MQYDDRLLASQCRLSVSLFMCPSVTVCIVALTGVEGWKLYSCIPSRQLPIYAFIHFCSRMYHLASKRSKKSNREILLASNTAI